MAASWGVVNSRFWEKRRVAGESSDKSRLCGYRSDAIRFRKIRKRAVGWSLEPPCEGGCVYKFRIVKELLKASAAWRRKR